MKKILKKNQKPLKNYVIVGLIFIATILLVLYLCNWYDQEQKYRSTIPELRGIVPEITEVELPHYVQENEKSLVYLCVPANENCRYFEKSLKKLIEKRELKDSLTYLNLEDEIKAPVILRNLEKQYHITKTLTYYPTFILFEGGKVKEVLQGTNTALLSLSQVENLLDVYQMNE